MKSLPEQIVYQTSSTNLTNVVTKGEIPTDTSAQNLVFKEGANNDATISIIMQNLENDVSVIMKDSENDPVLALHNFFDILNEDCELLVGEALLVDRE